jgi:hypothetical protein
MIDLRIKVTQSGLSIADIKQRIHKGMQDGTFEAAQHVEGVIKDTVRRMFPHARTGELMRSFHAGWVQRRGGDSVSAGAFSDLVYAQIQDEGGIIKPKEMKYLAIPLIKMAVGKWARPWPRHKKGTPTRSGETVCFKNPKSGKLLIWRLGAKIARSKGGGRQVTPIYVLKKSVKVTPKRYLDIATDKSGPGVEKILGHQVDLAISHGGVGVK